MREMSKVTKSKEEKVAATVKQATIFLLKTIAKAGITWFIYHILSVALL